MKKITINAYDYLELDDKAKNNVRYWLNDMGFEYEDTDANGNIFRCFEDYFEWSDEEIKEHCEINKYLFDKYGECVHHL